ncbi:MAG: alpha-amylase/4-alpha-glucanotransferase domain-containing protein, partial [Singulisphaera sp.]
MPHSLRLVLVLHQHQPVGNLDSVNEDIYASCYLPLLETLARYPSVPVNLHTSGSLLDWIGERHPEYLNRLRDVVASRRIEVLGGGYHDPILPMLSPEDRRGQMDLFSRRLGQLFGERPRGMWLPERIWEPSIAADMAACDIEHTVLDDFHFHAAGLTNDQLRGYYLTEAAGQLVAIFAGDEQLRYLIPFAEPEDTIAYLRGVAQSCPGGVMVYADDAEKFGAWPGMHERMQQARWLDRFLAMLAANSDWLHVTTLGETIDHVPPLGKVYLPEGSYREMERWSTLADRRGPNISSALPRPTTDAGADPPVGQPAPRGTWRNFRVIYPEVNEMYCRMLSVSRRCEAAAAAAEGNDTMGLVRQAQQALYRAQCGCAYWHGIFGGVYMPHLRQAVYRNLIAAEKLLDTAAERTEPWLSTTIDDFNFDVHKELLLSNGKLSLFLAPEFGGTLYELDERETGTNLLATFARRPEAYHGSPNTSTDTHPAPVIYDTYARKSLIDHFFDAQTTLDDLAGGRSVERGDFVAGRYRARLRRQGQAVSAQLSRSGQACGRPVTVTKRISLAAESSVIDLHYELTGLSPGQPLRFAIEFNFAGMPPGCADRYFIDDHEQVLPDLGSRFDLATSTSLRLVDRWLGLDVRLAAEQPAGFWAFPICTVSRSQRGLETIQQSVTVMPHWLVSGDRAGRFEIQLQLSVVNSAAGRHPAPQPHFLPQQRQAEPTG